MKLLEAKAEFISAWGSAGTRWGINRTMAQIHALLLITDGVLNTDEIMEQLQISRSAVNRDVHELMSWGLVEKKTITGERMEYFYAEKDMWKIAIQVAKERRRAELDPVLKISQLSVSERNKEAEYFTEILKSIKTFAEQADKAIELFTRSEKNWFFKQIFK